MKKRLLSPSLTFGTFNTVGSNKIFIQSRRGQVYANDAEIIGGDIMALNGAIHVIDTVLFTGQNQSELIIPVEIEPTPEPNPDATTELSKFSTVEVPDFDSWKQKIEKGLEKRMKRSAISKNYGNNCGTKRGPQPRHVSEANEGPKSKELAPLGRNSLAMRTKDSLINAFQKLFG